MDCVWSQWIISFLFSGLYVRDGIQSCLRLNIVDCATLHRNLLRLICRKQIKRWKMIKVNFDILNADS